MEIVIAVIALVAVVCVAYFTSGISNLAGTVFERKTDVGKKAK